MVSFCLIRTGLLAAKATQSFCEFAPVFICNGTATVCVCVLRVSYKNGNIISSSAHLVCLLAQNLLKGNASVKV